LIGEREYKGKGKDGRKGEGCSAHMGNTGIWDMGYGKWNGEFGVLFGIIEERQR
jgi:hypothetical protein